MAAELELTRIVIGVTMLGVATFLDLREREVHDLVWVCFGGLGFLLIILEPDMIGHLTTTGIALIVAPLVLLLWRFGLFGGADALGLIALSVIAPLATLSGNAVTPFSVLVNSALLSMAPLIANFARNVYAIARKEKIFEGIDEPEHKKILAMFFGYKAKRPRYSFSMEKTVGGSKKLDFSLYNAEKSTFCNKENTWVSPGLPFMVFILGGFLIQLFFGDPLMSFFGLQ